MTYRPRLAPREHQIRAAVKREAAIRRNRLDVFAYLMDMGTGKTKVAIDEFGEREAAGDISDLLVVAPAGCYFNWGENRGPDADPSELLKHLDPATYERLRIESWVSSGGVYKKDRIRDLLATRGRPRAFIVNVEALSSVDAAVTAVREFIESSERGVIFDIDEATVIRHGRSNRTEAITELGMMYNVAARRILTGLVTPNSPLDLFSQMYFLDWRILGFQSYVAFRARHAYLKQLQHRIPPDMVGAPRASRIVHHVTGFKNLEELNGKIEPFSFRCLKDECLDLPQKEWTIREVEMTTKQERMYREMRKYATAHINGMDYVTAQIVLAQRLRMDQILCGFTIDESGNLHEVPETRTDRLVEVLADYTGKAIIWSTHDYCIRKIAERLRKEFGPDSVAMFWGGNRETRHEDERRFKNDPECRFMVSTQMAGGRGNTWVVAGLAIYYNNDDDLEHRAQSEDRNHRDGLREAAGSALYIDLIAPNTIDVKKLHNLRNKIDIAALIAGDPYRDWLI